MKHLLFSFIIFCFSITCAWSQDYGAGVTHSNTSPVAPPQYAIAGHKKMHYDSTEQALWVNSKKWGWWLLMSPSEMYDRGIVNMYFTDNQDLYFNQIETKIRTQAGTGKVLNGLYIVKFTSQTGKKTDLATLSEVPILPPSHNITDNDYIVFRYSRNKLISQEKFDDRASDYFNTIETRLTLLKDSITVHRREIDSLKRKGDTVIIKLDTLQKQIDSIKKDTAKKLIDSSSLTVRPYKYIPFYLYKCNESTGDFNGANTGFTNIGLGQPASHFFTPTPDMYGDTIVGYALSYCTAPNIDLNFRLQKVDIVTGQFIYLANPQKEFILANQTYKYFSDLVFSRCVLKEGDRIMWTGTYQIRTGGSSNGFIAPKGMTVTMVIKPHK